MGNNLTNEEKLNRILELAEENNKMLRSLHRSQRAGTIFRILYWLIIIGSLVSAYYFLGPILKELIGTASAVMGQAGALQGQMQDMGALQDILKQLEQTKQ
jgi:hypothetical protein